METIPGIFHGFTSKHEGSMQDEEKQIAFYHSVGIQKEAVVLGRQVHGTEIHEVIQSDRGNIIDGVDGFVYKRLYDLHPQPVIAVRVGDCVPILCIDPHAHVIGVAHAGWRGTKDHIGRLLIEACMRSGANPSEMIVAIGPHIHSCCYTVEEERAKIFEREFPGVGGVVSRTGVSWCIDLEKAIVQDIRSVGVRKDHIDGNKELCTKCTPLAFFSFRRKEEPFGEILGFIGYSG